MLFETFIASSAYSERVWSRPEQALTVPARSKGHAKVLVALVLFTSLWKVIGSGCI